MRMALSRQGISSWPQAEQEQGVELSTPVHPQCYDYDDGKLFSRANVKVGKGEEEEESKTCSSTPAKFSAGLATLTHESTSQLHIHQRCAGHVQVYQADGCLAKEKAAQLEAVSSSSTPFPAFQSIQQRLIRPCVASTPLMSVRLNKPSASEHICFDEAGAAESKADADAAMKGLRERAEAAHTRDADQDGTAEEDLSSKRPLSSFEVIESRPTRTHVCQDSLTLTTVRPMVRGNLCKRRLFSKCINADDGATSSVVGAEKRARIEDYVDPFLLSEATQKVRLSHFKQDDATRNRCACHSNVSSEYVTEDGRSIFYWPSAELHAMVPSAPGPADWHWCRVDSDSTKGSSSFDWPSAELHAMTESTSGDFHNFTSAQLDKEYW